MTQIFDLTLEEALEEDATLLNNLQMSTALQTQTFIDIFKARWNIYECAGFSIEEFKKFVENKFKVWLPYFQELINDYENKINYQDGIKSDITHTEMNSGTGQVSKQNAGTRNNVYTELPNKVTLKEYPTTKDNTTENVSTNESYNDSKSKSLLINKKGDVNILDQKIKYQKYLRNVYLDFVNKFDSCFVLVY